MGILTLSDQLESIDRTKVSLASIRCLHTLDSQSSCRDCYSICPVSAIKVGKPPILEIEKCQNCLACLPVCPVGAFTADDDVSDLLACVPRVDNAGIELVCARHPSPAIGLSINNIGLQTKACLAGLGVGAYLMLYASGQTEVYVNVVSCKD